MLLPARILTKNFFGVSPVQEMIEKGYTYRRRTFPNPFNTEINPVSTVARILKLRSL